MCECSDTMRECCLEFDPAQYAPLRCQRCGHTRACHKPPADPWKAHPRCGTCNHYARPEGVAGRVWCIEFQGWTKPDAYCSRHAGLVNP